MQQEFEDLKDSLERAILTMRVEVSREKDFKNVAWFKKAKDNLSILRDMEELRQELKDFDSIISPEK